MEYLIGILLALGVAGFAAVAGFDRERSFYATVAVVVASYYILFAAIGASRNALIAEVLVAAGFTALAVLGFRKSAWFLAVALVGHGVFDFVHHLFIDNPGVPRWWPAFCLGFDALFGAILAVRLIKRPQSL